jgi:hypothetical protein
MPKVKWEGKEVDAIDVSFKINKEDWNEYQLEDGTSLRLKCVVSEVLRVPEMYDQEGNPTYVIKSANMVNVKSPDHLKKI